MAKRARAKASKFDAEKVISALTQTGVIKPDTSISDVIKATSRMDEISAKWTAVADSDKWVIVMR